MTKSYFKIDQSTDVIYSSWEQSILAPKFNLKNFADELHYFLRIYQRKRIPIFKKLIFLFLNVIQRIFYTFGTNFIKFRYKM